MTRSALAATALALVAGTTAVWAAPARKAVATDWTRTVVATPEGGYAMGNPRAPVTLVEYASLACSHCRDFAAQGYASLKGNYVKSGRVRFEYRPFILNGYDLAATTVAKCAGPRGFFPIAEAAFATQDQWMARIRATPEARTKQLEGLPPERMFAEMGRIAGFQALGATKGLPVARANACLADKAGLQRLLDQTNAGRAKGVKGTPTFFLNGRQLDASNWPRVEAAIKAAI